MITFVTILECSRDFGYICNIILCLGATQVNFVVHNIVGAYKDYYLGVMSAKLRG